MGWEGWDGGEDDLLWYIALLLRGLSIAVVVCHADAGGAVELADDFDLVGWRV